MSSNVEYGGETVPPPSEVDDEKSLPPMIVMNPRKKIIPASDSELCVIQKEKEITKRKLAALIWLPSHVSLDPVPKHPLAISWWPEVLCFTIEKKVVIQRLCVSNRSNYLLSMVCNGLWEEEAKLGASWLTWPHTIFNVAPGLICHMYVKATPRSSSSVKSAQCSLQISAGHRRDVVAGYFVVPIFVKFLNYEEEQQSEQQIAEEMIEPTLYQ